MAITSPAIETLRSAGVTFRLMPDADARGEEPTEQTQGLIKPFHSVACHWVYREKLPPVFVVLSPERTISRLKVADAVEDTVTSIKQRKPSDVATQLGAKRPRGEPSRVIVDAALARASRHVMFPSGAKDQTIVVTAAGLIDGFDAHIWDVSDVPVLQRVEPYFAVTADGIRSLEPDKEHSHVSPGEIYFPEVRQIVSIGATEEYLECFDRALLAAKKHHPKPSESEHAAAHFAFLKEH
ncbi:hypothetical protein CLV85_1256 [Salinibacterium amurskyense]|uniref:YbaK/aminoacyl-tRNA synthetase-associated domain-containing protein n=1 Tax=Salinibacterium amurskyense TaxID=205941 RepID=A0A2M9D8V1_9MICO|nr:hypothetical protein [Salinibacterium amurskyense]PJJ82068.1 hypothetical protein CLV85_1256 [Salinibacterium amurskyense]RLQ81848.1 hypothetical protein D9C83_06250 [Salinibacterium amurskyense]GHD78305.1 hypothetical protein GCM10007394_05670 [Salinibacterium amurskyense]